MHKSSVYVESEDSVCAAQHGDLLDGIAYSLGRSMAVAVASWRSLFALLGRAITQHHTMQLTQLMSMKQTRESIQSFGA